MNGGALVLLFLGLISFSIYRSRDKWMTALCALMTMGLTFCAPLVITVIVPSLNGAAVGSAAFDLTLLVGALGALVHSRKSKTSV